MTLPSDAAAPVLGRTRAYSIVFLVAVLVITTIAALFVGNGDPAVALAPTLGLAFIYALCKLPLKVPALGLMVMGFVLEIPSEQFAEEKWHTPFRIVGALLFGQLKETTHIGALVFTGLDIVLLVLFAIHVYRRSTDARIDKRDFVGAPPPMIWAALACLGGCAFAFLWGMARGGSFRFSLWQIQRVIYLPLMFLLLHSALPNARSYRVIGTIVLASATFRALLAIYVRSVIPDVDYATTHADSMLFAFATAILVIGALEMRTRRTLLACATLLPLFVWGMIANDRRLVWVELASALAFAFVFAKRSRAKIFVARLGLIALPVIVGYIGIGWSSSSKLFAPVGIVRSVVDSSSDTSTRWRDLENYNLAMTVKQNPLIGSGYGHPYVTAVELPDVTEAYELEPYAPHNSVLGIWAYTGYVGFALQWMLLVIVVYFAVRSYRIAKDPADRTAALGCFCAVVVYMVHLYGDLALGTWASVFLISSSMVISGKLAAAVGAWPSRSVASSARPEKPDTSYSVKAPLALPERSATSPEH